MARGGTTPHLREISRKEFDRIAEARTGILETLVIEEKFDLVMENYFEFEEEILSSSLRYVVFSDDILAMLQQSRLAITRRLANLLTTCRLYLDQSTHHLRRLFGANSPHEQLHEAAKSSQYDKYLSFRILEELRNYAQHRGYPFHVITFSSSLVEPEPGADSVTIVMPKLSITELEDDGGFKSRVLDEIKQSFEQDFDLRPHVRQYIDCLRAVQSELRRSLKERIADWKDAVEEAIAMSEEEIPEGEAIWSLELVAEDESSEEEERIFLAFQSIDRLESFAKKNQQRGSLTSKFVSGQVNPPSA